MRLGRPRRVLPTALGRGVDCSVDRSAAWAGTSGRTRNRRRP